MIRNLLLLILVLCLTTNLVVAQKKPLSEMTKEDVLKMGYDELIEIPLEDLMKLASVCGVSLDELYEMVLNVDVNSASKRKEKIFDSPLSTTVLTREEISAAGATSIVEALRLVPGMIVREKTPGNYDFHMRGNDNVPPRNLMLYSENSTTLIMIDGRVSYNYAFGGTFWDAVPIDIIDVERIEIVRGPAGALYGPNAVSGVINIITRETKDKKTHVDVHAEMGNLNSKIVNVSASGSYKNLSARISGNYQYQERFMDSVYIWPLKGYYSPDRINQQNPNNYGMPIKPLIGTTTTTADHFFPNLSSATNKCGANLFLTYKATDKINFDFSAGTQQSHVNSSILDDSNLALAGRTSNTYYTDLRSKIYGLTSQISYTWGSQNASYGAKGFEYDIDVFNANFEYDFNFKNENHFLNLRPGICFQAINFDDTPYLQDTIGTSVMNGKKYSDYIGASLRADYIYNDRLRFVAALREEKYSVTDKMYLMYQFTSSYKLNDNNIIRAVYSQSNRSPFMTDSYMNYTWQKIPTGYAYYPTGLQLQFDGNKDLKLAKMDMVELGYRSRILKNLQFDLEAFYSETRDFAALMPDAVSLYQKNGKIVFNNGSPIPVYIHLKYQNLDVVSKQLGTTADLKWMLNDKLQVDIYGTLQETKLYKVDTLSTEQAITKMVTGIVTEYLTTGKITTGTPNRSLVNTTNTSTPSFYGGFVINYTPTKKWNINTNTYYYTSQIFKHKQGTMDINAKTIVNLKVSYKVWKECSVFVNVRNLLNDDSQEFAFLDKIGRTVLGGINISF